MKRVLLTFLILLLNCWIPCFVKAQLTFSSPGGSEEEEVRNDLLSPLPASCPPRCLCVEGTVRCMYIQLGHIPLVPQNTQILDIRFNRIRQILPNSLAELQILETFLGNDNQIAGLEEGAFNGLVNLKFLYLQKNRIRHIHPNTFVPLQKLIHLYLNSNQINQIHSSTFSNLPHLERLFLHHNQIQRIPPEPFQNVPRLKRLRLDSNALICDCGMLEFASMVAGHPEMETAANCNDPGGAMQGKQVRDLSEMNLRCRKPTITDGPRDVEVNFGTTVYFACRADGDPAPTIVWLHNNNEISQTNEPRYSVLEDGTLMIVKAEEKDGGTYECMAKSLAGEAKSSRANMETRRPIIPQTRPRFVQLPKDADVKEGDPFILNCSAIGSPAPNITWFLNDSPILSNDTRRSGSRLGGLRVEAAGRQDGGIFQCTATNPLGKISAIAKVNVLMPPVWIVTPLEQSVEKGTLLSLHCEASGEPKPVISWTHNGVALLPDGHRIVLMAEGTQVVFKSTLQEDEGEFGCRAENGGGFLETVANVRIIAGSPPLFVSTPIYTNTSMKEPTVRLKCPATGVPPPTILWRKDGFPVAESGRVSILPGGTLLIHTFSPAHNSGLYSCSAFNDFGIIHSDAVHVGRDGMRILKRDTLDNSVVINAISQARREVTLAEKESVEALFGNISKAEIRSPFDLFRLVRFPKAEGRDIGRAAEIYERALYLISNHAEKMQFNIGNEFSAQSLLTGTQLELLSRFSGCIPHQNPRNNCSLEMCFHSRYRTIDGSCNNLGKPLWGTAYTPFQRLLPAVYENGFNLPIGWSPEKLYNGHPKPLARHISSEIVRTNHITPDITVTHMLMQWGQFLDHDLDHALPSLSVESYGERVSCRRTCSNVAPCFPMQAPEGDARVRTRKCMEFTRSGAICGSGITSLLGEALQQREQINQLTAYIDASQVYGSSVPELLSLQSQTERKFLRKGIYMLPNKPLMPFATDETPVDCRRNLRESDVGCFLGGDIRANEQMGLLAMHTVWFRQHNFLAGELKRLNPSWLDEVVFQEARKIIGAQMQHVTYDHWLPHVIGEKGMEELGTYHGYDPTVNPMISTEFATAALRFGHTLINPILRRLDGNFESIPEGDLPLRQAFFSPWRLVEEGGIDPLMRGLFATPAKLKRPNELLNSHLTEDLFTHAHLVALDLAAMNIQRGRDHGIPSYNEYRVLCNLSRARSFEDLKDEIPDAGLRGKLESVYKAVDNLDLWVGGIAEEPEGKDARVGPTFRCILVDQFRRLRDGDRFWYENPSVFRPEQQTQLRQTTLARILCDTGDSLAHVKRDVFLMDSPLVSCSLVPSPQIGFWAESENCCDDKSRPTCPLLAAGRENVQRNQRGRRETSKRVSPRVSEMRSLISQILSLK